LKILLCWIMEEGCNFFKMDLKERLDNIYQRIENAAKRSGRKAGEVKLIAVSKNQPVEKIRALNNMGVEVFGENRVQELLEKEEELDGINWHFIGHLQRNKVKYLIDMENCLLIHSLDSLRLAKEIDKRARQIGRIMPVLLEVNMAGDLNKYGFKPEEVFNFIETARRFKNIEIHGLMTIAPYIEDPEGVRPYFRQLNSLRLDIIRKGYQLDELSMGMTNDFEIAVEEGATMVRVGTGLFGERQ
jgi:PLP dependent protein